MSGTARLNLPLIGENDSGKYLSHNEAIGGLDAALADALSVSVASASQTITSAQYRGSFAFRISGASTGGRTVTLPSAVERIVIFMLDTASTNSVDLVIGLNTLTLQPGSTRLVYTDGAGALVGLMHGVGAGFMDIGFTKLGKPNASQVLLYQPVNRPIRFPSGLATSWARARVAATSSYAVTISRVIPGTGTTDFATATWSGAATDATLACASNTDFSAGHILKVTAPVSPDATLEDIGFNFATLRL